LITVHFAQWFFCWLLSLLSLFLYGEKFTYREIKQLSRESKHLQTQMPGSTEERSSYGEPSTYWEIRQDSSKSKRLHAQLPRPAEEHRRTNRLWFHLPSWQSGEDDVWFYPPSWQPDERRRTNRLWLHLPSWQSGEDDVNVSQ
jgi:hypothetical protein